MLGSGVGGRIVGLKLIDGIFEIVGIGVGLSLTEGAWLMDGLGVGSSVGDAVGNGGWTHPAT